MIRLKALGVGPMANFAYLLADPSARECAVVDPGWDPDALARAAAGEGWRITAVLLTHHHFDHSNGLEDLLQAAPAPVFVHRADAEAFKGKVKDLREVRDGDILPIGKGKVEFLHTPGHTRGSQCLRIENHLLTGDTLFIGGCGRVDLPDSDPDDMFQSLRRIAGLPGTLTVWPGHAYGTCAGGAGPGALLSSEVATNPCLRTAREGREAFLTMLGVT
ncbi:MAG: MBL fold metallo-hydrolase [Elusimicrobia bacterium]|nr:MBL fold metallo-hydrolase [Elusimicrobiota bacterium]